MKTVDGILREMRDFADGQEKNNYYDLREMSTDSFRAYADRIEAAVKHKRESAEDVIREMGGCCSVRVNCGNCGKGEDIYFVPKGLITKLDSVIAHEKGVTDEQ